MLFTGGGLDLSTAALVAEPFTTVAQLLSVSLFLLRRGGAGKRCDFSFLLVYLIACDRFPGNQINEKKRNSNSL